MQRIIYETKDDNKLLNDMVEETGLSASEIVRQSIRMYASNILRKDVTYEKD